MRDYVRFLVNGHPHEIRGRELFLPLADYLREQGATGTKIVCAEGDCGACSVLVRRNGHFVPINSCIQSLFQMDESSIVTVEGLAGERTSTSAVTGSPDPATDSHGRGRQGLPSGTTTGAAVQEAMIANHGAQCGYCTPGFVVAMAALFEERDRVSEGEVREGLTGNLCRCTGYEPIIKAACSVDAKDLPRMADTYPAMTSDGESVHIETDGRVFFAPATLDEALAFKHEHPDCTIVQGATDVGVWINKRAFTAPAIMSLAKIDELDLMQEEDGAIVVGTNVTLSAFDAFILDRIPELHAILSIFGSPQIRNAGTLVGNIANGSPIADTLPYLFVSGAMLDLQSTSTRRSVPVGAFYRGYKQFDLGPHELITRVRVPIVTSHESKGARDIVRLYKVSRRRDLDISAFTAAIRLHVSDSKIESATVVYGGVAPVVMRLPKTEGYLASHPVSEATFKAAGAIAREEIAPISDVRGSRDYRLQLASNILSKFYFDALA